MTTLRKTIAFLALIGWVMLVTIDCRIFLAMFFIIMHENVISRKI